MPKEIKTHSREFWCNNCDPKGEADPMSATQVKAHLLEKHKLEVQAGRRQGVQFLDGADFYSNVFTWTFPAPDVGEVKLTEVSSGPRGKPMTHAEQKKQDEIARLNRVLAAIHAATDLETARRRAFEGRTKSK